MSATPSSSPGPSEFISLVARLGYLGADGALQIAEEATIRGIQPTHLALQRGELTPVQVEIVETLLRPLDTIPGYEILDLLGHGGMGAVFRARQMNLQRLVALKTVLVSQMPGPAAIARFEQEATTVARLAHPHIVAAFDFGKHQGRLFLAMELVAGENAEDLLLRRGPLDETTTWHLVRQAAAGLAHAAQQGIVHRDIKPANLMLVKPPAGYPLPAGVPLVKIADFGLAFLTTDANERTRLTSSGTTLGSPHYMAPEQLAGEPLDLRADIYGLGATAYHLLAGRPPFHGLSMSALVGQKLAGGPELLANIAPHLTADTLTLVEELMRREPADRPTDYEALIGRVDGVLAELSSIAGAPTGRLSTVGGTTAKAVKASRRTQEATSANSARRFVNRPALVASGVLALALIGGLGWRVTHAPRAARNLKPTGHFIQLFAGDSLAGWRSQSGAWRDTTDDEGAPVIEGANGCLAHEVPGWQPGDAASGFRLSFAFRVLSAQSIEVHFDLPQAAAEAAPRSVLRLTHEGIQLGSKSGDRGEFRPQGRMRDWPRGSDGLHDVLLEKNGDYYLQLDGEPLGRVRGQRGAIKPEFRWIVQGGAATFADIAVEALQP